MMLAGKHNVGFYITVWAIQWAQKVDKTRQKQYKKSRPRDNEPGTKKKRCWGVSDGVTKGWIGEKAWKDKSVWSDGNPPTALPVVEQIGPAAERSDCRGDRASADRWLPLSAGQRAVHAFHWLEVCAHTHNTPHTHMHRLVACEKGEGDWRTWLFWSPRCQASWLLLYRRRRLAKINISHLGHIPAHNQTE